MSFNEKKKGYRGGFMREKTENTVIISLSQTLKKQ